MSLVEMIVVIFVIGIIAAIAVPTLTKVSRDAARDSRDKRNAQALAAMCSAGDAAGISFYVAGDLEATVDNILVGAASTNGAFQGQVFKLSGIDAASKTSAMAYLTLENDCLVYLPNP